MCGLTGFIDLRRSMSADALRDTVSRMAGSLVHRGPDDGGVWVDPAAGVAFGHRRLAILDLSPTGHQPMASHDGRLQLIYNGEIYNHLELRRELESRGVSFRGTSDTETLVEACRVWGVPDTLRRCRGIFALALYDTSSRELTLARDHLGIKPLYYGRQQDTLFFGSELKSFRPHPQFDPTIDRQVLPHYFRHNYVPAPYSIYRGLHKLPPGTVCVVRVDEPSFQLQSYWDFTAAALDGARQPLGTDPTTVLETLEAELSRAVREQMLSDVPLGAFLSGGIDSSLIVALMQAQSARPVKTFTIGFDVPHYNEAPYAWAVAEHLRTDHTEHYVTSQQALDVIPRLPTIFDEPFADSSQIPTFLVSQLARQQVTVALSGDGGDELFCGYRRYFAPLVGTRGRLASAVVRYPGRWVARAASRIAPGWRWRKFFARAADFLADADPDERYLRGMTHWALNSGLVLGSETPVETTFLRRDLWPALPERQQRWMWLDTLNYLPDDILVKVDRASMATSLETRVPLLDPKIVELAWRIPHAMKAGAWSGKLVLRQLLKRYVPEKLFERPKTGFGIPLAEWLRGPLRPWGEELLDERRLRDEGYLAVDVVRTAWQDHVSGRSDRAYQLWDVLMFQAWLDTQSARPTAA